MFLLILTLLLYSQILFFELTGCDDKLLLNDAKSFVQNSSFSGIISAPYLFQNALFYRPVVNISFVLPLFFNINSLMFQYLINLLIHSANSLLLFILLRRLNIKNSTSFLLVVLFAVHPVCVNAIAWLPGRNDSLLMMFILLSVIFYDRYLAAGSYKDLGLNAAFFLLSLLTKETAITAVIIFIIYFFIKKSKQVNILIYSAAGWIIASGLWYAARSQLVHDFGPVEYYKNLPFTVQAFGKTVLPFNLSVLPTINDTTYIYGIISILFLAAGLILNKNRDKILVVFGISWFLVFLLPPLFNINPEYNQNLMLESRLYLPFAGMIILFSQIKFFDTASPGKIVTISAVIIFTILCFLNIKYSSNYRNDFSFWENAVCNSPSLDLSQSGLGLINLQKENYEIAAQCYRKAAVLNPIRLDYNKKTGYCLINLNRSAEAEEYFRKELLLNPDDYDSNLLTGIICFKTGRSGDAEKLLLTAHRINKNDFQPPLYLLKLYHQQRNYTEAVKFAGILKSGGYKIPDEISKDLNLY